MLKCGSIYASIFWMTLVGFLPGSLQLKVVCYRCSNSTVLRECHTRVVVCYGKCYSHNVTLSGKVLYSKGCDNRCYSLMDYKHTQGFGNQPVSGSCCSTDYCNGDLPATNLSITESMSTAAAVVFVIITMFVLGAGLFKRSRFKQTINQRRRQIRAPNQAAFNNNGYDSDFRFVAEAPPYEREDKNPLPSYQEVMTLNAREVLRSGSIHGEIDRNTDQTFQIQSQQLSHIEVHRSQPDVPPGFGESVRTNTLDNFINENSVTLDIISSRQESSSTSLQSNCDVDAPGNVVSPEDNSSSGDSTPVAIGSDNNSVDQSSAQVDLTQL